MTEIELLEFTATKELDWSYWSHCFGWAFRRACREVQKQTKSKHSLQEGLLVSYQTTFGQW